MTSASGSAKRAFAGRDADGKTLRAVLAAATRALETNREAINALNVFPVPDGDTGTNMLLTMRSVLDDTARMPPDPLPDAVRALARAALLGARGNSGLILAQFFKGLAAGVGDADRMGAVQFARGLRTATDHAYASVPVPREGTMLTVFRECATCAEAASASGASLHEAWKATSSQAMETVSLTPTMLDVLRQAGVVDSGGYGFAVILSGGLEALTGAGDGSSVIAAPPARLGDGSRAGAVRQEFVASVAEEIWGYCTSFAVVGLGLDVAAIRSRVTAMGRSAVVAGDDSAVKVHVHVEDPGEVLSYGVSLGALSNVDIKNMDDQTRQWAAGRAGLPAAGTPGASGDAGAPGRPAGRVSVAVVAVVAGAGLADLYRSTGLGACDVVQGGDSMNPSTAEILRAIEAAPSEDVIVLPNNKNVIGTAREISALTSKRVRIVPTRSVQAGISALLAYSPDAALDENASNMEGAATEVSAGAVCRATRDVELDGHDVRRGIYIGLLDDRVVAVASSPAEALDRLLEGRARSGSVVTIYTGDAVSDEDAQRAASQVRSSAPAAEVEVVRGGQPHYDYLVSIE